jgi:group II intron reverse transcriptase/maturase
MHETLMEAAVEHSNAEAALRAVERNGGAAGIDGMTTRQLRAHLQEHWEKIRQKLLAGTYTPSAVRGVDIPKPGGGTRTLGIPTVMDRFIGQMLLQAMNPIFDPRFSESSYGFRPGRSAHQAVRAARGHIEAGKDWIVDIDISKFFDRVNHDVLMHRLGQSIRDKRVLRLIGRMLKAGMMSEGVKVRREEGTPQGAPLSPLLANIYLDALDKELEARGLAFSRYADDCNIYVGSESAALRVMSGIVAWLKRELRLEVNAQKSGVGRPWQRQYLGFTINRAGRIEAARRSIERFKARVREKWRGCQSGSSEMLRDRWRAFLLGWWGYYRLCEERHPIFRLEGWIRRHMRACFWQRWHGVKGRERALRRLGLAGRSLKVARSSKGAWKIAATASLQHALSNAALRKYGFIVPSDLASA